MKDIIGLAVLAWPLTLLVLIGLAFVVVISLAAWYAKRKGKNVWLWIIGAFLLVYLPIFWDWIPTVVMRDYFCEKEAGFWVYKTLEQWKSENPGVIETLVANRGAPHTFVGVRKNYSNTFFLNSRFNWIVKHNGQFLFNRWRDEQEVVDSKTGEVLARYVDFSTSQEPQQAGWSGWKFWLASEHCTGGERNASLIWQFTKKFEGVKK
jgi:hypothetical protein